MFTFNLRIKRDLSKTKLHTDATDEKLRLLNPKIKISSKTTAKKLLSKILLLNSQVLSLPYYWPDKTDSSLGMQLTPQQAALETQIIHQLDQFGKVDFILPTHRFYCQDLFMDNNIDVFCGNDACEGDDPEDLMKCWCMTDEMTDSYMSDATGGEHDGYNYIYQEGEDYYRDYGEEGYA